MHPIIKDALRDVNVLRLAFGMTALRSLPKGQLQMFDSCPIANALEATNVDGVNFRKDIGGLKLNFQTPKTIARFIAAFDRKRFPRFIERA
jgi:hypothetical protein